MTTALPQITLDEYELLQPNCDYLVKPWPDGDFRNVTPPTIKFLTPNKHCAWRVATLDTKEPDTIAWLSHMKPGEVLYDVGANMGQYSLIAAMRGLTVHAFEPESQNFALLCRNVALNAFKGVTCWPLCLSDRIAIDHFFVQSLQVGGSCSSFAEKVNFHLQPKEYPVVQGSMSTTMDAFADQYGPPTHIKIDVDGLEHKVIGGAHGTLISEASLKSVLVEINSALPEHLAIIDFMRECGFEPDTETADLARRTDGPFAGIGNIIFYRK